MTSHCDVAQPDTLKNIEYVLTQLGSNEEHVDDHGRDDEKKTMRRGADRIDHGLDATSSPELVQAIAERQTLMTLCPWAYVRHHTQDNLFT